MLEFISLWCLQRPVLNQSFSFCGITDEESMGNCTLHALGKLQVLLFSVVYYTHQFAQPYASLFADCGCV